MTAFTQWMLNIETMLPFSALVMIRSQPSERRGPCCFISTRGSLVLCDSVYFSFFNSELFQPPHSGLWTMYVAWDMVENQ